MCAQFAQIGIESPSNSELDSADILKLKIYCQIFHDVDTYALLNEIVLEIHYRWRSFEVSKTPLIPTPSCNFQWKLGIINAQIRTETARN